ncbi:response regulator [Granulicella sibirica]|uniref:Two component transcriptional regulator, LuxR family n=1 Tax=Granulicella sibirica TaxID=2479048 RepID=A0A4V1L563_9BACT|nr:response regulator transcription factor [Granulicella sibirica]RXH54664.1 two component transcriptional regulator, LuxR family [Granulicella sibirica]
MSTTPSPAKKIRILTVDDHPLILEGIANVLQKQADMEVVGEAADGHEAIEAYAKHRPDVMLIDLQMPGINGIDTIIQILEKWPNARCVVLTTYAGDVQAARALKAGAKGYLLKSMLRKDLVDTIRIVHSGKTRIPPEIASELANHFSSDALSAREIEVLRMVGEGCSNKIVADHLHIAEDTVKGHMRSILSKLNANDRTHAVMIAVKRGFLEG